MTRVRMWILAVFAAGAAATVLFTYFAPLRSAYRAPAAHVALETAAAIVAFIAALLVFGRYSQSGRLDDLILVAALGVFSFTNLVFAAVPGATGTGDQTFTTWAPLIGRLMGALLLAASTFLPPRHVKPRARTIAAVSAFLVIALLAIGGSVALESGNLPFGVDPAFSPGTGSYEYVPAHRLVSGAQLIALALFVVAAVGFTGRKGIEPDEFHTWIALSASFAAISSLNYALFPSLYTEWVYTGDLFRLLFYLALLIGAARVIRSHWRDLATVAVLEERARLARDLHDGVAQELAFISRRARRLEKVDAGLGSQIAASAQRALVDSRLVIAALARPADDPLETSLARVLEDTATRAGANIELELAPGIDVSPEVREALIRIATEAVGNAARHSGAGTIRVALTASPSVRLSVRDDGAGFDPDAVTPTTHSGFGLTSMRERARALEADFRISSRPGEGTEVEVVLP